MAAGSRKNKKVSEGQRFSCLVTVKSNAKRKGNIPLWECLCDCGQVSYVATADLNRGHSKSCGHCDTQESYRGEFAHLPELRIWKNIKSRCNNVNAPNYKYYGGRGVKLKLSFKDFLDEVGERPSPKHTIDRIDVNGHYEKGNLRWALRLQQQRNTRRGQDSTASIYKKHHRWISRIGIEGKTIYLGSFKTESEAQLVRKKAIEEQTNLLQYV